MSSIPPIQPTPPTPSYGDDQQDLRDALNQMMDILDAMRDPANIGDPDKEKALLQQLTNLERGPYDAAVEKAFQDGLISDSQQFALRNMANSIVVRAGDFANAQTPQAARAIYDDIFNSYLTPISNIINNIR